MAPTAIWPSPPTLVRRARSASTKPVPTSAKITARLTDAPIAYGEPQAPSAKADSASPTGTPVSATSTIPISSAANTAASGISRAGESVGGRRKVSVMCLSRHHCPYACALVGAGRAAAHDAAAVQHHDAVGDRQQFIEFGRNQQHRDA